MYRSCDCLTFISICSAFERCLLKEEGVSPDESFDGLSNPRESFLCTKGLCWYEFGNPIVDYSDKRTPNSRDFLILRWVVFYEFLALFLSRGFKTCPDSLTIKKYDTGTSFGKLA